MHATDALRNAPHALERDCTIPVHALHHSGAPHAKAWATSPLGDSMFFFLIAGSIALTIASVLICTHRSY